MKNKYFYLIFTIMILVLVGIFVPVKVTAHPGRTASDGCHNCRTNCSKWGVSSNVRHCHSSKGVPQPSEPVRSHYKESGGYTTPAPDYKIPKIKVTPTSNKVKALGKINTNKTATVVQSKKKEEKTFWLTRFFRFMFGR